MVSGIRRRVAPPSDPFFLSSPDTHATRTRGRRRFPDAVAVTLGGSPERAYPPSPPPPPPPPARAPAAPQTPTGAAAASVEPMRMQGAGIAVADNGSVSVVSRGDYEQQRVAMARQLQQKVHDHTSVLLLLCLARLPTLASSPDTRCARPLLRPRRVGALGGH